MQIFKNNIDWPNFNDIKQIKLNIKGKANNGDLLILMNGYLQKAETNSPGNLGFFLRENKKKTGNEKLFVSPTFSSFLYRIELLSIIGIKAPCHCRIIPDSTMSKALKVIPLDDSLTILLKIVKRKNKAWGYFMGNIFN